MAAIGAVNGRDNRTPFLDQPFTIETTAWDPENARDILYFAAPDDGRYRFEIDPADVLAPVLTIRKAD